MKAVVLALLACFVAVVLAQTPPKPDWPAGWSATVQVERSDEREPYFFRWFWDQSQQKDRIDGLHRWHDELYWGRRIFDHPAKEEISIFYQEGLVNCITRPINQTLPKPNFAQLEYRGTAVLFYTPVYHWYFRDIIRGHTYQVYDRQDNREIVRVDVQDERARRSEQYTFFEYDVGLQDPELFKIPSLIADICKANPF